MKNLQEIYNNIEEFYSDLFQYDSYSPYQKILNELINAIYDLYKYFGIRQLKIDIGPFKKNEVVQIEQDESGAWLTNLDYTKTVDLYEYMLSPEELFYE